MKLERLARIALLLAWTPLAAAAPSYESPSGLTVQAQANGRFLLLWDPIYRDDLMGYSVWLRKPGEREFTRLSVPVKVGKEVRKLPLVNEARLVLALGSAKRDVEATVAAEYEDASSERAPSVFIRLARRTDLPPDGPQPQASGTAVPAPDDPAATPTPGAAPEPDEDKAAGGLPWVRPLPLAKSPLLAPFGRWRSELGVDFDYLRSIRKGQGRFGDLGLIGTGIPSDRQVRWERVDVRTIFAAPLTLRYGILPGFEAWAQGSYHAEDVSLDAYNIDGQNFDYIVPVRVVNGQVIQLSDPTSSSWGDSFVGMRVQPLESVPLVLGAKALIPTGQSRFRAFLDWYNGKSFPAGTGEGVQRMEFGAEYGLPGRRPGLSFHGAFSPGVTERVTAPLLGSTEHEHVLVKGSWFQLGGGYTLPWAVRGLDGAIILSAQLRSIDPSRWTVGSTDVHALFGPHQTGRVASHTQAYFSREDQLELSATLLQDLPGGLRTGGRVGYFNGVQGDGVRLSGQFYY